MRFGLLGCDPATLDLLREAVGHSMVCCYGADEYAENLANLFPSAMQLTEWESMLTTSNVDGVVVAANWQNPEREIQLRKLVQEQIPLLLVMPPCEGIVALELEMIQRDTHCAIVPYVPGADEKSVAEIVSWLAADPARRCEQIQIQRSLEDRTASNVLAWLARDIELARRLGGDVTRVTATGGDLERNEYHQLAVNLEHRSGVQTRWSNQPAQCNGVRVEAITSAGKVTLDWQADEGTTARLPDGQEFFSGVENQNGIRAWQAFSRCIGAPVSDDIRQAWSGNTHSLEAFDSILYSIKRKRTIEMREDVISEQATFKALMAAGGCFMLLWAFFVLMLAAFGSIFERPLGFNPAGTFWLPLLLAPLAIFLAAQLLQLIFRKEPKASQDEPPQP